MLFVGREFSASSSRRSMRRHQGRTSNANECKGWRFGDNATTVIGFHSRQKISDESHASYQRTNDRHGGVGQAVSNSTNSYKSNLHHVAITRAILSPEIATRSRDQQDIIIHEAAMPAASARP